LSLGHLVEPARAVWRGEVTGAMVAGGSFIAYRPLRPTLFNRLNAQGRADPCSRLGVRRPIRLYVARHADLLRVPRMGQRISLLAALATNNTST
jgi:hypothetical protein